MKEAVKQALQETLTPVLTELKERMGELTATVNDRVTVVESSMADHEARIASLEVKSHTHASGPPFAGEVQ